MTNEPRASADWGRFAAEALQVAKDKRTEQEVMNCFVFELRDRIEAAHRAEVESIVRNELDHANELRAELVDALMDLREDLLSALSEHPTDWILTTLKAMPPAERVPFILSAIAPATEETET